MKLFFNKSGQGTTPLLILHGLFGSGDNWRTVAKAFENKYTVYLIDQRNHGRSPHSEVFDYQAMANDLAELIETENLINPIVLGHSMGGKTAMQFTINHPTKLSKLIIADMGIKAYNGHHSDIFDALFAIRLEGMERRTEAEAVLVELLPNDSIRQLLLKNLYRLPDNQFAWRFNLPILQQKYTNILTEIKSKKKLNLPTHFILGEQSPYVKPADYKDINKIFPQANFTTISGAGHWVHSDKPIEFIEALKEALL